MKLYQAINQAIVAIKVWYSPEWVKEWEGRLDALELQLISELGLDGKVSINRERSGSNSIVIYCEFHRKNDCGESKGWSKHTLRLVPDFALGIKAKSITGKNHDVKDYLAKTFRDCLNTEVNPQNPGLTH